MRVEMIAVGGSRTVPWQGSEVVISIFETPVASAHQGRLLWAWLSKIWVGWRDVLVFVPSVSE